MVPGSLKKRYSKSVSVVSNAAPVELTQTESEIQFSAPTHWRLYNKHGQLVAKDFGATVDVRQLKPRKGSYQLEFDNRVERIRLQK